MATEAAAVSAVIEVARKLIKQSVALTETITATGRKVDADRAAITAMLAKIGVTHRWVGSRLDLMGTDGAWVVGTDLRGIKGDKGASFVNRGDWQDGGSYAENEYVFDDASAGETKSMWVSARPEQFVSTVQPKDDPYHWVEFVAPKGDKGDQGDAAWSPVYAVVADGARFVQKVVDWVGGQGAKPVANVFVGPAGFVGTAAEATNVRGASGDGSGDMVAADYDSNADGKVNAADAADTVPWSGVTGKPSFGTAALAAVADFANADQGAKADSAVQPAAMTSALALKANLALVNAPNGIAALDASGKVPAAQLPSYVDDILEFANLGSLPVAGETGKIYVALNTGKIYRWSGSAYVEVAASPGSTDAVTEGVSNLYFTAARVLGSALTGLSLASAAAVAATDTILVAIGKLQAQISGKANAAHTHATSDVAGFDAALAAKADASALAAKADVSALASKLDASAYTAADVLAKALTVDGSGSGLDADKWKGASYTVSTATPSGGADGDFWFERQA